MNDLNSTRYDRVRQPKPANTNLAEEAKSNTGASIEAPKPHRWDKPLPKRQRDELITRVGDHQGWRCHYCGVAVVDPRAPSLTCDWIPGSSRVVGVDGPCSCGKHDQGETCATPGGWYRKPGIGQSTLDHRTPRSRGGTDEVWNIELACDRCNAQKGSKPYLEYLFEWVWNGYGRRPWEDRQRERAALLRPPAFIDHYLRNVGALEDRVAS